jgi:hypothetical protein
MSAGWARRRCIEAIVPKAKTLAVPITTSFFAATLDFKSFTIAAVVDGAVAAPMALVAILAARPDGAETIAPATRAAASAELVDVMPRLEGQLARL